MFVDRKKNVLWLKLNWVHNSVVLWQS